MAMFNMLLPNISAIAMSIAPRRNATMLTTNSGAEVVIARNKLPTKLAHQPVTSAISLPINDSHIPAAITAVAAMLNLRYTVLVGMLAYRARLACGKDDLLLCSKRNICHIAAKYNVNMIMLGIPTHPKTNHENLSPLKTLPAATAMSNIPQPADNICSELASLRIGVRRCRISSNANIARLMAQLPKSVPKTKSGEATQGAAALTPVISSGIDVTAAISTSPIHIRPSPVFSARASPY